MPANYSQVVIDDSTFQGVTGAALMVDGWDRGPLTADIEVRNGSRLLSGINVLAEARRESTLNLTVDDSVLSGDLLADDTSTINLVLQNNARLTGDIVGGDQVAVASGARWTLTGDNKIGALTLDGGGVDFGTGSFKELVMNSLSGSGHFAMRVDLDQGDGDLLWVEGPATGQFGLHVRNTGSEAVTPELEPLLLVHTEGGDAQFSLTGERVDLGAFSYQLQQQGNDWFIVADDRRISPSTASALALFNAAPSIWMSELNSLRSRIGEVRGAGAAGGWMRSYGSRLEATTGDGVDYRQKQRGFSLGADAPVPVANGQLSLGVLVGHSRSDLDLNHGTTGSVDSVYLGGYGTWLSEQGYYVDAVLKLNHLRNKSKVAMSDSGRAKGSYDTLAAGASVEFGRHVQLADGWFVEPFTQLAAVNVSGDRYQLDNGLRASNDHTRSVLGKVGASLGRDIALKDGGVLQPYVRLAAAQEFSRRNPVEVNGHRFDNDLFGSRLEAGAGVSVSLSERLQLQADFNYMDGKRIEQPWGANLGLRLAF
ncbi:autotransporter outer membrane beta-barrel domain-containing protein [uncultured Pseudomonas sp.]|uniref:autotransporter outer membrane beta-barrel domain-containing protein n=1 Tax=uncultured Pseudomonas sp. TaxID=114707 RepID=UPI0025D5BBDA|nr:autotransporter outer membrane beta-barrel domain-containing protein [uncultured Pseudomonas sp.]